MKMNAKKGIPWSVNPMQAKKADSIQSKEGLASRNVTRGKPTRKDHAGDNNPNYALYVDYYGNVCARYIGPYYGLFHMLFGFLSLLSLTIKRTL